MQVPKHYALREFSTKQRCIDTIRESCSRSEISSLISAMAPTQLEIKVRALQRLVKEENYYQLEIEEQTQHVEKLRADKNVDPYDLKKQEEVQKDTEKLLPTMYKKIEEFKNNLQAFLQTYQGNEDLTEAKSIMATAEKIINEHAS